MSDAQTDAFVAGEADRYFHRNKAARYDASSDPLIQLVSLSRVPTTSTIEVGAGTGDRVAAIIRDGGGRGVAVEPSRAAVIEGRRRHPGVEFVVGTAHQPNVVGPFGLVVVNFVFHWIGRAQLLESVASVDRLVEDGGYLAIGDFAPTGFTKTVYRHNTALWTYKQDYPQMFRSSGLYAVVAEFDGNYGGIVPAAGVHPTQRARFALLHKSLDGHYQEVAVD